MSRPALDPDRAEEPAGGRRFPPGFAWGTSTASYQIEGAVTADGRGESIWDRFAHTPGRVWNGDTGDVACDHYHRFREDVMLLDELGLNAYRFSIAWPRVVPDGSGAVNEAGLDFYDRLVDALLEGGIEPYPTLYHWDLPQALEDAGGWPERATAEAFARYAGIVADRLGDRVQHIATINEPYVVAELGYGIGTHAPGRTEPEAALAAGHHLLVAHGLAAAAIRASAPDIEVGIVLNFHPKHPATQHMLDQEAAIHAHDRLNRWYLDPIVGRGYPEDAVGLAGWRRDEVRDGDLELIASPLDFLGINYYCRHLVRSPSLPALTSFDGHERTEMGWEVYPAGLVEVLEFAASRTGDVPLYVTENGAAYPLDPSDPTSDPERISFLERHFEAALVALERGLPLHGYFVWSLMDNFEWAHGYSYRFGIVHVDFNTLERRVRDSARFVARVAEQGLL
jgi:beta-glucosidase